ncbi:little elongation complex subunit 2-like, partial [Oculina patagonica]
MGTERLKSSFSVHQDEVFFTQENYKKYSCRPSFVEFLEKHLSSPKDEENILNKRDDINTYVTMGSLETAGHKMNNWTNSSGAERSGSNGALACLGSAMEFPFVSKISIESQKMFLKVFETLRSGQLAKVDLQEMKAVQDIKNTVLIEQEEYQQFVHRHAKTNHHLYNFIHPDIWDDFKAEVEGKLKEIISKYPQHYSLQETIGLAVGAVFKSDAVLTFEQTLLQVGNVPKLCLPENTGIMLSEVSAVPDENTRVVTSAAVKSNSPKVVSEDPIAVSLAKKHKADIVISSSGLNTLLDNQPPDYRKQWQLPITVRRQ